MTAASQDLTVQSRPHTSGLQVTQERLGRRLDVVDILKVIRNLPHQNVLVGRGQLRAAFLMTARELVHLLPLRSDSNATIYRRKLDALVL